MINGVETERPSDSAHRLPSAVTRTWVTRSRAGSVVRSINPAAAIQTALEALPSIGSGNVLVYTAKPTNDAGGLAVWIKFTGTLAGTSPLRSALEARRDDYAISIYIVTVNNNLT